MLSLQGMKWQHKLALFTVRAKFKILSAFSKSKAAREAFDLFCTPPSRYVAGLTPTYSEAEQLNFEWNGINIRGFRWNKGASRKALIVHGFQSSVVNFEGFIQPLIKEGMEIIAFDAPAHGGSGGNRITAVMYSSFLKHIEKEYGPVDAVVAHSFGGLAISLALEDWPSSPLPRLALIAPASEIKTSIDQFFDLMRIRDKKVMDAFYDIIRDLENKEPDWYTIRRVLQDNDFDLLWVHDEIDELTPIADAENAWETAKGKIEIIRTKGLGHRKIYRDAGIVSKVVGYLSRTS